MWSNYGETREGLKWNETCLDINQDLDINGVEIHTKHKPK